jgi:hypothetical protein
MSGVLPKPVDKQQRRPVEICPRCSSPKTEGVVEIASGVRGRDDHRVEVLFRRLCRLCVAGSKRPLWQEEHDHEGAGSDRRTHEAWRLIGETPICPCLLIETVHFTK